jgi:hypothetical protein
MWNPLRSPFIQHENDVAEARDYLSDKECQDLVDFFETQNTKCPLHGHTDHTGGRDSADFFTLEPECVAYSPGSAEREYGSIDGIKLLVHEMKDIAHRFLNSPVKLAKVIFHKYTPGSTGPEHVDIFPLASLLYLSDGYTGGELVFNKKNVSISPNKGSVYTFAGGGENTHSVNKVEGANRYVIVAFWEYEDLSELKTFWDKEHEGADVDNLAVNNESDRLKEISPLANVMYPVTFPILEIKDFIGSQQAEELISYLDANHIDNDECWGNRAFREYWVASGDSRDEPPQYTTGVTENTISDLREKIEDYVSHYLNGEQFEFSKFKGHKHIPGAMSPPHLHPPASVTALLFLNGGYSGGEVYFPLLDIEFTPEPRSLYIFREGENFPQSSNAVKQVIGQTRYTISGHWQPVGHPYDKAGASIRNRDNVSNKDS